MKRNIFKSLSLMFCTLLMAACSINRGDSDAYIGVIPNDAMLVSKVDAGALLEKSDVQNNTLVKVEFEKAVAELPDAQKALLKGVFANPKAAGVDVDAPVYIALVGVEPLNFVATARMNDVTVFENMLSTFIEDGLEIKEYEGLKYIPFYEEETSLEGGQMALAYDADRIIFVADECNSDLFSRIALPAEKSAVNDAKFASLFKNDDDVVFAVNYEPLVQFMIREKMVDRELIPFVAMAKEGMMFSSLDFENGYFTLNVITEMPDEYRTLYKEFMQESTRRHYAYIPDNAFLAMSHKLNMFQLYDILGATGLLKELEKNGVNNDVAKELLVALSGDYSAAVWVNSNELEDAEFMVAVDCSDRSLFDLLVAYLLFELNAQTVEEDVYSLFDEYCLMYKDGAIMLMPKGLYAKVKADDGLKPLKKNLNSNTLFKAPNDVVFDLKPIRKILLDVICSDDKMSQEQAVAMELLNVVDNITVDTDIDNYTIRVNTTNKKINSLKYILDKMIGLAVRNAAMH